MTWKYEEERKGSKISLVIFSILLILIGYTISEIFELGSIFIGNKPKKALDPLILTQFIFILFGINLFIIGFGMIFVWLLPIGEFLTEELDKQYDIKKRLKMWLHGWR